MFFPEICRSVRTCTIQEHFQGHLRGENRVSQTGTVAGKWGRLVTLLYKDAMNETQHGSLINIGQMLHK